jgi:hypothetical protein
MAVRRYIPKTIKHAISDDSLEIHPIWRIYDTRTKNWWPDRRNQPTHYYDCAMACGVLNSGEK